MIKKVISLIILLFLICLPGINAQMKFYTPTTAEQNFSVDWNWKGISELPTDAGIQFGSYDYYDAILPKYGKLVDIVFENIVGNNNFKLIEPSNSTVVVSPYSLYFIQQNAILAKISTPYLSKYISITTNDVNSENAVTNGDFYDDQLNDTAIHGFGDFKTGTLAKHMRDNLFDLLDGPMTVEQKRIFLARTTEQEEAGQYTWNTEWFAYGNVNLTGFGAWRSLTPHYHFPIVAVSPWHFVTGYSGTPVGTTIHFFTQDNQIVSRTVIAYSKACPLFTDGHALFFGLLNDALPPTITPAKLMPHKWEQHYAPSGHFVPIEGAFIVDQEKKGWPAAIYEADRSDDPREDTTLLASCPTALISPNQTIQVECGYTAPGEALIGGDSGSPAFAIINHQAVVLGFHRYGNSDGSLVGPTANDFVFFQTKMAEWNAQFGTPIYTNEELAIDLSMFIDYDLDY